MKKAFITIWALLIGYSAIAQEDGNYILILNNDSIQIDLGNDLSYKTSSGNELKIKLIQPNILTYTDEMISFQYNKELSVSNTKLDVGIEQCMVMKSTGNGFMVQKYKTINPTMLTALMMSEITKQNISYGYKKTEKPFSLKLKSGQTIEGVQATLTYKGDEEIYTVATYGAKDEGILVVTMLLTKEFNDKEFIDLFLNTLKIHEED